MQTPILLRPVLGALLAALAASPLAAQPGAALPANEGFDLAPPPGFPPFTYVPPQTPNPRARMYTSELDGRMVLVSVNDPIGSPDQDLAARRLFLGVLSHRVGHTPTQEMRTWEDSTHLVSDARFTTPDGHRGFVRTYMARTGAPWSLRVIVTGGARSPDADPQVRAYLAGIRLPADAPRRSAPAASSTPPSAPDSVPAPAEATDSVPAPAEAPDSVPATDAAPVTFVEGDVEVTLPPGMALPEQFYENPANGVRIFRTQAGSRRVRVFVAKNQTEDEGADWSVGLRIRHMEQTFQPFLRQFRAEPTGPMTTAGGMSYRDFAFGDGVGQGRARMYTTRSGPHHVIAVIYTDDHGFKPGDEDMVNALFQSVRVR